jgi:hypothetical protein
VLPAAFYLDQQIVKVGVLVVTRVFVSSLSIVISVKTTKLAILRTNNAWHKVVVPPMSCALLILMEMLLVAPTGIVMNVL